MTCLADMIARNAGFAPEKIATTFKARSQTYAALSARIEAAAAGLAHEFGIGSDDRIAHLGSNSDDFLVLLFAAARLGAALVPLNWRLAAQEHAYILRHARPKLLVVEQAFAGAIAMIEIHQPELRTIGLDAAVGAAAFDEVVAAGRGRTAGGGRGDSPLLIVYTSGTTGRPKGAILTQDAIRANAMNSWHMHGMMAADRVLTALPMFHVGGLNIQTIPALLAGADVEIIDRFTPEAVLSCLAPDRADRPTLLVLVPATIDAVLSHPGFTPAHLSSLRLLTTGSTIISERYVETLAALGLRLIQVYGATETGPIVVYERFDRPRHLAGTTGVAGLLNDVAVMDDTGARVRPGAVGEIAVRGPNLFSGYWCDREATAAAFRDGWYLTGDLGSCDEAGHFTVTERKRNVIIAGGENIYPAEIERLIAAFPGVAECAIVGRADARWQEVPVAMLVTKPGETIDIAALEAMLAENLARYKLPRAFLIRDALPKSALGKVQHFALKAELATAVAQRPST